jgi:hypothetical protein
MDETYQPGARLTESDAAACEAILARVRAELSELSCGDALRLHLMRRRVTKSLSYDERSTPMARKALKKRKMTAQGGLCSVCGQELPENGYYAVLDRQVAHLGYTDENVRLIHAACDYKQQEQKGFA